MEWLQVDLRFGFQGCAWMWRVRWTTSTRLGLTVGSNPRSSQRPFWTLLQGPKGGSRGVNAGDAGCLMHFAGPHFLH